MPEETILRQDLHDLIATFARFGATDDGGVCRLSGTAEDKAARDLFAGEIGGRGLRLDIDGIGNMFATAMLNQASGDAVLVGSHLDSQPTGGRYDGVYGVLAGLLAAEAIVARAAAEPGAARRNLVVVNWTNEEGARFQPSLTGSSVFAGVQPLESALSLLDGDGQTLGDALGAIGYRGAGALTLTPRRYVELHIEQGARLEESSTDIGIVAGAWAARKISVVFEGEASHTGPMPMPRRRDALRAAARGIETLYDEVEQGAHASAARISLYPNSPNVVPSRAQVWFEIRHEDEKVTAAIADRFLRRIGAAVAPLGVTATIAIDEKRATAALDPEGVKLVQSVAGDLGFTSLVMKTVAGHDALALQKRVPATLIFVPSRNGLSHNAREFTEPAALDKGLAVLIETLWRLVTAP
ncbi:Zn-dependent hydrolase [Bradyrhizobium erythrophlei]|uniref:Zn-dependent hydrolase n=1 Tax=Bradyrhizobium erythrophlei TaxID=1437360 RepID=UPI0009A61D20|nr:Zn-dependent hydrolase [Bradyrhizobium erythrophlei]